MKIEKIEIKKELLDIPSSKMQMYFAVIPSTMSARKMRKDEITTDSITVKKVSYDEVRQAWSPQAGFKNYLVKVDDRGIFDDLIKFTENDLEKEVSSRIKLIQERVALGKEQAIRWDVEMSIKKLPWHTRLFNNF